MRPTSPPTSEPRDPPSARTYRVTCLCGETVAGTREDGFRIQTCPTCSASLLVMGASPLPSLDLRTPARRTLTPRPATDPRRRGRFWRRRRRLARRWVRRTVQRVASVRRLFTIPVLVGLAVFVIVAVTVVRQIESQRVYWQRTRIESAAQAGRQALAEGDLSAAYEALRQARIWMSATKNPTSDWRILAEQAKAVEAIHDLLPDSLHRLLSFVAESPESRKNMMAGKGMLIDAETDRDSTGAWRLETGLFTNGIPIQLDLGQPAILDQLALEWPTRLLLAMKIQAFESTDRSARLIIDPNSVTLVTQPELLKLVGVDDLADLVERTRQQESMLRDWATREGGP